MQQITLPIPPSILAAPHAAWPRIVSLRDSGSANGLHALHLRRDKQVFLAASGDAYLSFRPAAGVAVVLGRPVGDVEAWEGLVTEFRTFCAPRRLTIAYCGVEREALPWFQRRGFQFLKIGDEARVDLAALDLRGERWRECRAALNRAERCGVSIAWVPPEERTASVLEELRAVSRVWLAGKALPELSFGMSEGDAICDPDVRLAVARDAGGRVQAFVTWTPVRGAGFWSLDLMRRRASAMPGIMDALIARSLLWMRDAAYAVASLGGTPLSNVGAEAGGARRWAMDLLFRHVRMGYRFRTLWHYKSKFNPAWQPFYLAVPRGESISRACYALVRACAPDLAVPQLLRRVLLPS